MLAVLLSNPNLFYALSVEGRKFHWCLNGTNIGPEDFIDSKNTDRLEILGDSAFGHTLVCIDFDDVTDPSCMVTALNEMYTNRAIATLSRSQTGVKMFLLLKGDGYNKVELMRFIHFLLPDFYSHLFDKNALTRSYVNYRMYTDLSSNWDKIVKGEWTMKEVLDTAKEAAMAMGKEYNVFPYEQAECLRIPSKWSPAKIAIIKQMGYCSCRDIEEINQERLAVGAGITQQGVSKILKELIAEGWITKTKGYARGSRSSSYRVNETFHAPHSNVEARLGNRHEVIRDIAWSMYQYGELEWEPFFQACQDKLGNLFDRECIQDCKYTYNNLTEEIE
jgi:DNA-binding MarR family transcriptional regulator